MTVKQKVNLGLGIGLLVIPFVVLWFLPKPIVGWEPLVVAMVSLGGIARIIYS